MARLRTRLEVEAVMRHYMPLLGISDWSFKLIMGFNPEDGQSADVECKPRNRYFILTFYRHQFARDESDWFRFEGVILHELIHVMLSPMVYALRGDGNDIESQARAYYGQELCEEPLVAELERLLLRYLPRP